MTQDTQAKEAATPEDLFTTEWPALYKWSLNMNAELIKLSMLNQFAWTRFYMQSLKSGKDTPALLVEWVDQMSGMLDNWEGTQRDILEPWATAISISPAVKETAAEAPLEATPPPVAEPAPLVKPATTRKRTKASRSARKTDKASTIKPDPSDRDAPGAALSSSVPMFTGEPERDSINPPPVEPPAADDSKE